MEKDPAKRKRQAELDEKIERYLERLVKESTPLRPIWDREGEKKEAGYNWSYVSALFLTALLRLYEKEGTKAYLTFADAFMDAYVTPEGGIHSYRKEDYNLDSNCGGRVLMDLYGLYMAQPFYMRYGAERGRWDYCRDSLRQFQNVEQNMNDIITGLYYHGYDESKTAFWADKKTGCSRNFWLRSIGWLAMACVDTLEVMPTDLVEEKKKLNLLFRALMDAVIGFQDRKSGMWYQVMDQGNRAGNYLETSGSAMLACALMKGARRNYLPTPYRYFGQAAFDGICRTRLYWKGGKMNLGGICLVAGLGGTGTRRDGTYGYYISEPVVENDAKGIGPFLLAYAERFA